MPYTVIGKGFRKDQKEIPFHTPLTSEINALATGDIKWD